MTAVFRLVVPVSIDVGILGVVTLVPINEVVEGTKQEGTGTAGRVHDTEVLGRSGCSFLKKRRQACADNLANDPGRRVVDAARVSDLRLLLDANPPSVIESDLGP